MDKTAGWKEQAAAFLQPWKGRKILAAVSGGPDSMAMLEILLENGADVVCAHVNYHKRVTADRDEQIVRDFCSSRHIPVHVLDEQNPEGNFQAWARKVRYDFFARTAAAAGCQACALAHQRDDSLETWMMQKEKHILPECYGLKEEGRWKDLLLIRPLLQASKADLQAFCQARQVPYGIDETNLESHYRRNQLRHSVIEAADEAEIGRMLQQMEADRRQLDGRRAEAAAFLKTHLPAELLQQPDAWFLLDAWLSKTTGRHYARRHLEQLVSQLQKNRMVQLDGWELERHGSGLFLVRADEVLQPIRVSSMDELKKMEGIPLGSIVWPFVFSSSGKRIESLELKEEDFPIEIGAYNNSDEIRLPFGRKKVKRALMDRRIPKVIRKRMPIVRNRSGQVVFVPAIGCDVAHFSCNPSIFVIELSTYIRV